MVKHGLNTRSREVRDMLIEQLNILGERAFEAQWEMSARTVRDWRKLKSVAGTSQPRFSRLGQPHKLSKAEVRRMEQRLIRNPYIINEEFAAVVKNKLARLGISSIKVRGDFDGCLNRRMSKRASRKRTMRLAANSCIPFVIYPWLHVYMWMKRGYLRRFGGGEVDFQRAFFRIRRRTRNMPVMLLFPQSKQTHGFTLAKSTRKVDWQLKTSKNMSNPTWPLSLRKTMWSFGSIGSFK